MEPLLKAHEYLKAKETMEKYDEKLTDAQLKAQKSLEQMGLLFAMILVFMLAIAFLSGFILGKGETEKNCFVLVTELGRQNTLRCMQYDNMTLDMIAAENLKWSPTDGAQHPQA